jgi:Ty3 transposon capsid-like protein
MSPSEFSAHMVEEDDTSTSTSNTPPSIHETLARFSHILAAMDSRFRALEAVIPPNPTSSVPPPTATFTQPVTALQKPLFKVNTPTEFTGDRKLTYTFLTECQFIFDSQPSMPDPERIRYLASFLRGQAQAWYIAVVARPGRKFASLQEFLDLFLSMFGENDHLSQEAATSKLLDLKQSKSVQAYAARFQELSVLTSFNEAGLMALYKNGLKPQIKQHLLNKSSLPSNMAQLVEWSIAYDDQLGAINPHYWKATPSTPTPMEIDLISVKPATSTTKITSKLVAGKLSQEEKSRRNLLGLCAYCGEGHLISNCQALKAKNEHRQADQ